MSAVTSAFFALSAVGPVTAKVASGTLPIVAGRTSVRSTSSALFDFESTPFPTSGIVTRATSCEALMSTSTGFFAWPLAIASRFRAAMPSLVAGESVFALTATIAGATFPFENAFSSRVIVGTVGASFGSDSSPLWVVCSPRAGNASKSNAPPATSTEASGCFRAGVKAARQNRLPPASLRNR